MSGFGLILWALCGFMLGAIQALILQKHTSSRMWLQWTVATGVGWFVASQIALFADTFVSAGTGLNPEADVRGCSIEIYAVAGILFGTIQGLGQSVVEGGLWAALNGFAWGASALGGGIAGFVIYDKINTTYSGGLFTPDGLVSIAFGIVVGLAIYGAITGLGMIGLLRYKGIPNKMRVALTMGEDSEGVADKP